jgi:hypothetical protein
MYYQYGSFKCSFCKALFFLGSLISVHFPFSWFVTIDQSTHPSFHRLFLEVATSFASLFHVFHLVFNELFERTLFLCLVFVLCVHRNISHILHSVLLYFRRLSITFHTRVRLFNRKYLQKCISSVFAWPVTLWFSRPSLVHNILSKSSIWPAFRQLLGRK